MINAAVAAWSVPVRCQPLFSCRTPTDAAVATFLGDQSAGKFSYDEVGQSRDNVLHPSGYTVDDLRAFSQPRFWPVRLGKPIARALQRRFVRESQVQMRGAVEAARV